MVWCVEVAARAGAGASVVTGGQEVGGGRGGGGDRRTLYIAPVELDFLNCEGRRLKTWSASLRESSAPAYISSAPPPVVSAVSLKAHGKGHAMQGAVRNSCGGDHHWPRMPALATEKARGTRKRERERRERERKGEKGREREKGRKGERQHNSALPDSHHLTAPFAPQK